MEALLGSITLALCQVFKRFATARRVMRSALMGALLVVMLGRCCDVRSDCTNDLLEAKEGVYLHGNRRFRV
jgi:hypothetical protein